MTDNGYNEEEMKMVKETKKIWGNTDVNITATCIRVPIMRAHAESINLEFERDVTEEEVSSEKAGPGIFTQGYHTACCKCLVPFVAAITAFTESACTVYAGCPLRLRSVKRLRLAMALRKQLIQAVCACLLYAGC